MSEKVLMKGNEAIAEAAIKAGCRHYFGYPITPQTEVAAYMSKRMPKIGGTFLQAESEVAAINMVIGVSSTGKRVMTSSSSPGVSLKSEGISYLAGCDLPALVVNVQRGGPGLGGIQPSQSDYFQAVKGGSHGDYRNIVLAPASVQEMASLTIKGFELADKYRMVTMLLADGTLGQMMEPVEIEDVDTSAIEKPWATTGTEGKRKTNIVNSLFLKPDELEAKVFERFERYKAIEENEVMYEEYRMDDAEICVVGFGIASRVAKNAINAAREKGIKVGMIRPITLWPFPKAPLLAAADKCKAFISVEMNMGQMIEDIELAIRCKKPVYLCNRTGGMIPSTEQVLAKIEEARKALGEAEEESVVLDKERATIFWENDVEEFLDKINSLLENPNMSPAETEKLEDYKSQAEEILEIIHTPKEYISLRFFYLIRDYIVWTFNGIGWLFSNLFNIS